MRLCTAVSLPCLAFLLPACHADFTEPRTVELPETPVRRQTINNCWIQTATGWAEALAARGGAEGLRFSPSYLTYRYLEDVLRTGQRAVLDDISGNFLKAALLIKTHGLLREEDFRGPHGEKPPSDAEAMAHLSRLVAESPLSASEVRAALDEAFGVRMELLESKVLSPKEIVVGKPGQERSESLEDHLLSWQPETWSLKSPAIEADLRSAFLPQELDGRQQALLGRMKRALGAGFPLPTAWFADLSALDASGRFSASNWHAAGRPGLQGGHSTLLVDYEARLPDGRHVPEGSVSPELRGEAEMHGSIVAFIMKNSWGAVPEEESHPTYRYRGRFGYSWLEAGYLFAWIPELHPATGSVFRLRSGLESVSLPPGY